MLWGSLGVLFGRMFLVRGVSQSEYGENLDFDDPLEPFARLLRSQGLQNEVKRDPKTRKERREEREEQREARGERR